MLEEYFQSFESMGTDRKASCESKVDKKYHEEEKRKKKQRERYEQRQKGESSSVGIEDIQFSEESVTDSEQCASSAAESELEDEEQCKSKRAKYVHHSAETTPTTRIEAQKKKYTDSCGPPLILPEQFHIRESEKKVRDEVC